MNLINVLKIGGGVAIVIAAYFFGYSHGQNKEELSNARAQISALNAAIEEHKAKQANDAQALSDLRIAESRARDEYEWMRGQLSELERRAKTAADRERNRCLRLAAKGKELLDRAEIAIRFCAENHK